MSPGVWGRARVQSGSQSGIQRPPTHSRPPMSPMSRPDLNI